MNEIQSPPELVIFDGTAMLFRAFFGMRGIFAPDGTDVSGIFGASQTLLKQMRQLKPKHVAVVFDMGPKTFRNTIFPEYKANRDEPPEALIPQFDLIHELFDVLGFACYGVLDFEADDVMATLSRLAREAGMSTRMINSDKDLCQLVNDEAPAIVLHDLGKGKLYDTEGVIKKLGVPPHLVIDYQSLVGDSTDNIAGVKGVGPKTALALIEAFGTLEDIYANLENIPTLSVRGAKKLPQKLEEHKESAFLSKQLVTLRQDVELPVTHENIMEVTVWNGPKGEPADLFFDKMGFHRQLTGMRQLAELGDAAPTLPSFEEVDDLPW